MDNKQYFNALSNDKNLKALDFPNVNEFYNEKYDLFLEVFNNKNLKILSNILDVQGRNSLNKENRLNFLANFRSLMLFKLVKTFENYSEYINENNFDKLKTYLGECLDDIYLLTYTYIDEELTLIRFLESYYPKEKLDFIYSKIEKNLEKVNLDLFLNNFIKLDSELEKHKNLVIKVINYIFALVLFKRDFSESYNTFGVLGGKHRSIVVLSLEIFKSDNTSKQSIEELNIDIFEPTGFLKIAGTKTEESIRANIEKALDYIIEKKPETKEKILGSDYLITVRNTKSLNDFLELNGNSFDLSIILLLISSQLYGVSIQLEDGICATGEILFTPKDQILVEKISHEEEKVECVVEYNDKSLFTTIKSFYYPYSNNNFKKLFEDKDFTILKEYSSDIDKNNIYLKDLSSFDDIEIIDQFDKYINIKSQTFENINLDTFEKNYPSLKDIKPFIKRLKESNFDWNKVNKKTNNPISSLINKDGLIVPSFIGEEPKENAELFASLIAEQRKNSKIFKSPIPVIMYLPEILRDKNFDLLKFLKKYFSNTNIASSTIESYLKNNDSFIFIVYDKNFNTLENSFRGEVLIEKLSENHYVLVCSNSIEQSNYFKNYLNSLEIKIFNEKDFYKFSSAYRNVEETRKIINNALNIPFEIYKEKTKNNNFEDFLENFYTPKKNTNLPHYIPLKINLPKTPDNNIDTRNLKEYFEKLANVILNSESVTIYLKGAAGSGKTSTFLAIIKQCFDENNSFRKNMFIPCYLKISKNKYDDIKDIFSDIENLFDFKLSSTSATLGYSLPILFFIDKNIENKNSMFFDENIKKLSLEIEKINSKFKSGHKIIVLERSSKDSNSIQNNDTLMEIELLDIEVSKAYISKISKENNKNITSFIDTNSELLKTPLLVDFINWICIKTKQANFDKIESNSDIYKIFTREYLRNEYKIWRKKDLFTWAKYDQVRDRVFSWNEDDFSKIYSNGFKYCFEDEPHPVELILMILAKDLGSSFIDTVAKKNLEELTKNVDYIWLDDYRNLNINSNPEKRITNTERFSDFSLLKQNNYLVEFIHPSFSDYYYAKSMFYDLKEGKFVSIENKEFYEEKLNNFDWISLDLKTSESEKKVYQSNLLNDHTFEALTHFINLFESAFKLLNLDYFSNEYFLSLNLSKTAFFYLAKAYDTYFDSNLNYNGRNIEEINDKEINELYVDFAISLYNKSIETELLENEEEKDHRSFNNMGSIYKSAGLYEEAEDYYKKGLKINYDFEALHYNLGHLYLEQEKYENAISCFKESIRLIPDGVANYLFLSLCYAYCGNVNECYKYVKILATKNITKEKYKKYLQEVHKILKEKYPNLEQIELGLFEKVRNSASNIITNSLSTTLSTSSDLKDFSVSLLGKGLGLVNSFFTQSKDSKETTPIIETTNQNKKITLIKGDITELEVDAIVNPTNRHLYGTSGIDGKIHREAGEGLTSECKKLNGCKTGEAKITKGYNLPAKNIIHTVGPIWHGGDYNEDILLANSYKNSLALASANGIKSLAFPSISTGNNYYPLNKAVKIALREIIEYQKTNPLPKEIIICCFEQETYETYLKHYNETYR